MQRHFFKYAGVLLVAWALSISALPTFAQTANENRARAYYMAAEKAMAQKDYDSALEKLRITEQSLGRSNARISALRVKILAAQNNNIAAREELDRFFQYPSNDGLLLEMSDYLIRIDDRLAAEKAERERVERERLARLEAERVKKEEAERVRAAAIQDARQKINSTYQGWKNSKAQAKAAMEQAKEAGDKVAAAQPEASEQVKQWGWKGIRPDQIAANVARQMEVCEENHRRRSRKFKACRNKVDEASRYAHAVYLAAQPFLDEYGVQSSMNRTRLSGLRDFCNTLNGSDYVDEVDAICRETNGLDWNQSKSWAGVADGEYLPIVKINPVYPRRAQTRGIEGYVILEYTVTPAGTVENPVVIESMTSNGTPTSIFNQAALTAAVKFKYKPRIEGGTPVAVHGVKNKMTFTLSQ